VKLSCAYLIYNHILLEISGSHSNFIGVSYMFHYGNELVSRTGNKEIRHFLTMINVQKNPFANFVLDWQNTKNDRVRCSVLAHEDT